MATWTQWIIGAAGLIPALLLMWTKLVRPLARLISTADEMLPVLTALTENFSRVPHAFDVLEEIVEQVRTDSGSSLLDTVRRLEEAAIKAAGVADTIRIETEAARLVSAEDRARLQELILKLDRMNVRVKSTEESSHRIEADREQVASDLAERHAAEDEL